MKKEKIGVVVAMWEEARPLLTRLGLTDGGLRYERGMFYEKENIVIGVADVGVLAAAMCTQTLIQNFSCTLIINYGTCGSTGPALPVGAVVSIDTVFKGDVDMTLDGFKPYELPRTPIYLHPQADPAFPAATCRTTDRFIGANEEVEANIAVEMEAYSVAYICYRLGVPCRIYKVVSDMIRNNVSDSHEHLDNLDEVSEKISDHICKMLQN